MIEYWGQENVFKSISNYICFNKNHVWLMSIPELPIDNSLSFVIFIALCPKRWHQASIGCLCTNLSCAKVYSSSAGNEIPGPSCPLYLPQLSQLGTITRRINTLRPRRNRRHFADDTLKRIFMNENARISINISLKFVPKGLINNIPALVQIMAWRRPGDKPLSEPMMVNSLTHICHTRPQWVSGIIIEMWKPK